MRNFSTQRDTNNVYNPQKNSCRMRISKGAKGFVLASMIASCFMPNMAVFASDGGSPIMIDKPSEWKQGETKILITVDDVALGEGVTVTKIEAKVGEDGSWKDITKQPEISISKNCTVYVRVTDSEGVVYEQNRSIKCYDSEKPTLTASLTDGILHIQGNDTISGIKSITINGTEYTDLDNGQLKVQLTQKDFVTQKFELTATDMAGNISEKYVIKNPYYEWAVKQVQQQSSSGNNMSTTTDQKEVTSPLPQEAKPSAPTTSTGTVTDHTTTDKEVESKNETVQSITSSKTSEGKEFYTITTKSGKTFYLVIDNEQSQDNVYFLTEVSEQDLMNFTMSDTITLPDVDTVYATVEKEEVPETEEASKETEETKDEVKMPEEQNPLGSYLLIGLIAVGAGVGAWYMKVYKPKHEYDDEEDEYEGPDETYENEDEEGGTDSIQQVLEDEDEEE